MKRGCLCMAALLAFAGAASADELRLKDGTKIVGTIVGFEDNSFKVQTGYGFALVRKDAVETIILAEPKKDIAEGKKPTAAAKAADSSAPPAGKLAPAQPAPVREEVDGNTYVNHTYGFRMYKPPSWRVIEGAHKMLPTAVAAMGTTDETTLLVVGREMLGQAASLETQAATSERRLHDIFENYRALGEKRTTLAGLPAIQRRFRGTVDAHDWSGVLISFARDNQLYTIVGVTYADSDLIQIQENVIARAIASLEFLSR